MGRGKGNPTGWIARVSTGQILFEMDGVTLSNARQAATLATHKPCSSTKFVQCYYKNLYSSPGTASPLAHLEEIIPTFVTEADNSFLTSIPTEEEIHKTIFSMDPHSAPGPDEFSGAFFQGCWDIIKAEVIQFVQYFFQHSWLPPNLNSNLITLIPKVASADSVNQFKPIALANFLLNP
ncbi:hypothetical protein Patl1_37461 [Pistacia atlantica]|nr:hypothetical protein Patl1_37461 [Pistacia atlantica]